MAFSILDKVGLVFALLATFFCVKVIVNAVYKFFIAPAMNKVDFKSKGKWALVTGCTDGIGKQYAFEAARWRHYARRMTERYEKLVKLKGNGNAISQYKASSELAARGCDIVLVSRNMDKLRATATEIETKYKVSTKVVQADFSTESIYDGISKAIEGLEIGTLVNNVGISYTYPEYFLDLPDWETTIGNLIRTNIVSVTRMSGLVMPGMVQRGKGVIINIGSGSSIIPSPLLTVYAATKAYVEKFTEGLEMEYGKKGIIIQCVLPGFVCSNMSGIRRSTTVAPSASDFVKSAISLVGTTTKTAGYFPHAIFFTVINSIYAVSSKFSVWLVTRTMETSRRKYLKKYKKQ